MGLTVVKTVEVTIEWQVLLVSRLALAWLECELAVVVLDADTAMVTVSLWEDDDTSFRDERFSSL
jgi:hypothetical protein